MQKGTECWVLQSLHVIVHGRFAVVVAVGHIVQKKLDLFRRNYVADVLRALQMAKGEADHFIIHHGRAAAVSRIDRRVNLDA